MHLSILEMFGEHYQGRLSPMHIFSLPVTAKRAPDIQDEDRQAFQDILAASAKGQTNTVIFLGEANPRVHQGKASLLALASQKLKQPLCLLDCPALVKKYIGETEKNLYRVLADAESQKWILFFDEADALFGKRSKLEAHQKNSLIRDSSHILDIVMQHKGLLILSLSDKELISSLKSRQADVISFR